MTQRSAVVELIMHILSGLNTEVYSSGFKGKNCLNKTAYVHADVAGSKMGTGLTHGWAIILNTVSPV